MSALTFTPGKFYKTRDGRKDQVVMTDFAGEQPLVIINEQKDSFQFLCADGRWHLPGGPDSRYDLIAEWVDAPEVDWSKMPEGAQHVTIDEDGEARAWEQQPRPLNRFWTAVRGRSWKLYPQHVPKWSGEWRDSLVTRPTEGGK